MNIFLWRVLYINLDTVQKKSPWLHYNTRILRLYSDRLEYIDPKSMTTKGSIRLNNQCKAVYRSDIAFDIITGSRTFVFKVLISNPA